ncbi:hypothetical protein SAMN02927937_00404 [Paenimyroides aquimaris]|uniref:Uncharacterized protein n=1 Tax=Paenimyroides marinum TaxID=1159016 RepID=A0A1H6JL44_9FLAO|nr:hypothetical protein [Paenimyroides aquimaris]SEH59751.1 hypothetical protein SAMN02927937_00404 [Paenimyroides aquimaris]
MPKLLLSTLACVAFAGSSFAANEVVALDIQEIINSEKPCTIQVTVTNPDGSTGTRYGDGGNTSLIGCGEFMDFYMNDLRERGYTFDSETDVVLIWG